MIHLSVPPLKARLFITMERHGAGKTSSIPSFLPLFLCIVFSREIQPLVEPSKPNYENLKTPDVSFPFGGLSLRVARQEASLARPVTEGIA